MENGLRMFLRRNEFAYETIEITGALPLISNKACRRKPTRLVVYAWSIVRLVCSYIVCSGQQQTMRVRPRGQQSLRPRAKDDSMRAYGKKRRAVRYIRGSSLLKGCVALAGTALFFRLIFASSIGAGIEQMILSLGDNPGFVAYALESELVGTRTLPSFKELLGGESVLLGDMPEVSDDTPMPVVSSPAPYTPATPDGAEVVTPATPDGLLPSPTPYTPYRSDEVSPSPVVSLPPSGSVEEITFAPTNGQGYSAFGGVYIKNQTKQKIDVESLLGKKLKLPFAKNKPQVLIIHTHGSEAYTPDANNSYTPTDTERTEDTRYNIVRVGDEVAKIFEDKGIQVIHDRNIYDSPTYTGSYTRSLASITKIIKENPSIQMVIDVHRDSIQRNDGKTYKTVATVDGQKVAQLMLVIGSNDSGLTHPDWKQNLALAAQLQQKLNKKYPTLMRPIDLRRERFNQHATPGSMLLEVGTSGNSLEEALAAAGLFADTLGDVLGKYIPK